MLDFVQETARKFENKFFSLYLFRFLYYIDIIL